MQEQPGSKTPETRVSGNRHLELALSHCSQSWFPINPQVLGMIQEGFKSGKYDGGRDTLLTDLKQDLALFSYTVKALISKADRSNSGKHNPSQLIEKADLKALQAILNVNEDKVSNHRMGETNELQTLRLKQSMICATTAELLAEDSEIDPELGFSCGLFRQLGLMLIAWNYPHVYKRVISTLKPDEKLDFVLNKILGFSPNLLGMTLAREWGLAPEIRMGMGDASCRQDVSDSSARRVGEGLEKICKIGEALARASDPEHYPSAKHDWAEAKSQIEEILGPDGMKILRDKLERNCEAYGKQSPELFQFSANFNTENLAATNSTVNLGNKRDLFKENTYARHCPQELQEELKELYSNVDGNSISKDSVDKLTKRIIPGAGFIRGCIYLIEPDTLSLVPRLLIGAAYAGQYETVQYQSALSEFDPVVAAFRCQYPVMEEKVVINEQLVSYVAGVLGDTQKAGVFYLEISDPLLRNRNLNILIIYKALRQALTDCLALNA